MQLIMHHRFIEVVTCLTGYGVRRTVLYVLYECMYSTYIQYLHGGVEARPRDLNGAPSCSRFSVPNLPSPTEADLLFDRDDDAE